MKEAEQIMKRCQVGSRDYDEANNLHAECYRVIGKLLKTIAELESQEPLAWTTDYDIENMLKGFSRSLAGRPMRLKPLFPKHQVKLLFTHPPQRTWVGLTDEQMRQICGSVATMKEAVREAEAILKEGNT
jgi:hypothetical protein